VFSEGDSPPKPSKEEPSDEPELDIFHSPSPPRRPSSHRLLEESRSKCAFHPDIDAMAHCKNCGRLLCYACANEDADGFICEPCEQGAEPVKPPAPEPEPVRQNEPTRREETGTVSKAMARGPYVPWECRQQLGGWHAFTKTWAQSLFTPFHFFSRVPIIREYQSPLLYGFYWTLIGLGGGLSWRLIRGGYPGRAVAFLRGDAPDYSLLFTRRTLIGIGSIVASPLLGLLVLVGACLLYHVFVVLMTSRHARFESTLRVVCYSAGTNIFFFIPLVGALVGGVWQFVLVTVGLRQMHRIAYPTAVTIALIPYTMLLVLSLAFLYWALSGYDFGLLDFLVRLSADF